MLLINTHAFILPCVGIAGHRVITRSRCEDRDRDWPDFAVARIREARKLSADKLPSTPNLTQAVWKRSFVRPAENLFPRSCPHDGCRKISWFAVSLKSRPKFYFEKERPSFHTAWTEAVIVGFPVAKRLKYALT